MVILAMFNGNDFLGEIYTYLIDKKDFIKNDLEIEEMPSKGTLSRILSEVSAAEVSEAVIKIIKQKKKELGKYWAADGQAIRSTIQERSTQAEVQRCTILDTETRSIIAERNVDKKTNEIPVLQAILQTMKLEGIAITGDVLY